MKKMIFCAFLFSFVQYNIEAQFRKNYELKIEFEDFDKFYSYHDFHGQIVRVNQKNTSQKETLHNIHKGDFPQNGRKFDIKLGKNEDLELKLILSRKKSNEKIQEYFETLSRIDIEENPVIRFKIKADEWKEDALSTKGFVTFLKSIVLSREQKALIDDAHYSKLSSLPLGTYVFIDKKNPNNIQRFRLKEFENIEIDSTIPTSSLVMAFKKIVKKETNGKVDVSFNQSGIFASIQSIIESSDFVELNMNLNNYYKKYIKNIGAIHFKYLTTDKDSIDDWFLDKINTINKENDKNRFELHFTTGYKLIDELKITYNSYKKFENENNIDLNIYNVVTANGGAKLTRFKSVQDTTIASDYLIDVETENLTTTFLNLAELYKLQADLQEKDQIASTRITYAEEKLKDMYSVFKESFNKFLKQYRDKGLPIEEDFNSINCKLDSICIEEVFSLSRDLRIYDADLLSSLYENYLYGKYENLNDPKFKAKTVSNSLNILKSRFLFIREIAFELIAIKGSLDLFKSQINGRSPLSFKDFLEDYIGSDEYKNSGNPIPEYIINSIIDPS